MRKTADKNRKLAEKKSQPDKLAEKKSPPDKLGEKKKSNPDKLAENKSQDEKLSETRYRAEKLDLNRIASRTQGFTGADLTHLTQAAGLRAIRRALAEKQDLKSMTIRTQDFLDEIDRCKPSPAAVAMAEVLANWSA
uniref:AAA ATPase AAA+ lid domain-containing protein n=2 Tax=Amorphochlora amoebiformis TaxID=1561963 RepID=A0A7S0DJ26_9EUKA|mmetsp:Transcript_28156/g.44818  ORF Transcript_28156/g.44818 Transcript_28156/m.44818 type:complete len:137 (+) Transcript_28156:739-1149(+)